MRCPSCDGIIEESDVQFCPFCGMRIRSSQASDPDRRAHAMTDAPGSSRRSQLHPLLEILKKDRRYSWIVSEQPISPAANFSLIFALLGVFSCVPLVSSILAIVVGYRALHEIAASDGRLGGRGRAIASIIMGYIQLALLILGFILVAILS